VPRTQHFNSTHFLHCLLHCVASHCALLSASCCILLHLISCIVLCLPLPVSVYPFLCPDTALSSPSWLGSFCMPCKQQRARGHTNRWHFYMSQGLPLPVSVYTPILCPDTVLMSPSWMGFFDMQTTMDDSGNLKNNTWCSDDGNGNSTCSSSGCSGMLRPRYVA
jgi:hypothetical protein